MDMWAVSIEVFPRNGVVDPQGSQLERQCRALGFGGFGAFRSGKLMEFTIQAPHQSTARSVINQLCRQFLVSSVLEDYSFRVRKLPA